MSTPLLRLSYLKIVRNNWSICMLNKSKRSIGGDFLNAEEGEGGRGKTMTSRRNKKTISLGMCPAQWYIKVHSVMETIINLNT